MNFIIDFVFCYMVVGMIVTAGWVIGKAIQFVYQLVDNKRG